MVFVLPFFPDSPYRFPNVCYSTDKENLFNNKELLRSVVIFFILVTVMFDSGGIR